MTGWNDKIIEEFRANEGRVGGPFEGVPLVLLHTTGARSGRPHITPLVCLEDGERLLVFGSNAGGDRHPAWFHNIRALPRVAVERGSGVFTAVATVLEGEERDRLYARQAEVNPAFAGYQAGTERVIPVVALLPVRAVGDDLVRIHEGLRRELADLVARLDEPGVPELGAQLREHCRTYCGHLREHHLNEEVRGFPLLERHFPELAPTLDLLRAEHVKVGALRAELESALDGPATEVRDRLRVLTAELEAHFAFEERSLADALNRLPL